MSRSKRRLAYWVKSLSARTRSISAESESAMSWFTLVPCIRATVSASAIGGDRHRPALGQGVDAVNWICDHLPAGASSPSAPVARGGG